MDQGEESAFADTFVMTMVNGGAKYMPESSAKKHLRELAGAAQIAASARLDILAELRVPEGPI